LLLNKNSYSMGSDSLPCTQTQLAPPQWRYLFKANLATDRITNPENTRLVRPVRSTVITRTRTRLDRLYQNKFAQSYILRLPMPMAPPAVYRRRTSSPQVPVSPTPTTCLCVCYSRQLKHKTPYFSLFPSNTAPISTGQKPT